MMLDLFLAATLLFQTTSVLAPNSQPDILKEWISLTLGERKEYNDAVSCLYNKSSILPKGEVPGAINRRDNFTAVHINQTFGIHVDAVFLGWHRNFLNLYETALREECYQPYWDWTKPVNNISAYPLFDGNEYSIGGDGKYDSSAGYYNAGAYHFAHGTGGGCIESGPFVDLELHLGPIPFSYLDQQQLPAKWTMRNNHCLARDFNVSVAQEFSNASAVAYLLDPRDIGEYQSHMSGVGNKPPGPHTAGQLEIAIEMFDLWTSPNGPAFFFHHSNVDRMCTIWQNKDLLTRQFAINGTILNCDPPTAPLLTLDAIVNWGVLGEAKPFGELMSNLQYGFNHVYEDMEG